MIEVRSKCISCEKRWESHIYLPKSKFSFFIISNLKKHNDFWRLCEATLVLFVSCPLFSFYVDISPSSPVEASLILFPASFNLILLSPFKVDTCIIFYTFLIFMVSPSYISKDFELGTLDERKDVSFCICIISINVNFSRSNTCKSHDLWVAY